MPKARRDTAERWDEVIAAPAVGLVSSGEMPDFNSNAMSARELPLFPCMVSIKNALRLNWITDALPGTSTKCKFADWFVSPKTKKVTKTGRGGYMGLASPLLSWTGPNGQERQGRCQDVARHEMKRGGGSDLSSQGWTFFTLIFKVPITKHWHKQW